MLSLERYQSFVIICFDVTIQRTHPYITLLNKIAIHFDIRLFSFAVFHHSRYAPDCASLTTYDSIHRSRQCRWKGKENLRLLPHVTHLHINFRWHFHQTFLFSLTITVRACTYIFATPPNVQFLWLWLAIIPLIFLTSTEEKRTFFYVSWFLEQFRLCDQFCYQKQLLHPQFARLLFE